jgi:hypothetical protein
MKIKSNAASVRKEEETLLSILPDMIKIREITITH